MRGKGCVPLNCEGGGRVSLMKGMDPSEVSDAVADWSS